jgi:predicted metal-dependent hydrolase
VEEQFTLFGGRNAFVNGNKFIISVSENTDCNRKEVYSKWLKQKAEKYIPARVNYLANKIGVKPNRIKVKEQKTRWGSCSSSGNIALNYKLMRFHKKVIDYVIIHELCHLKEMNHSRKFWDLVFSFMPDYQIYKKQLTN